ncbi:hypothetical protein [Lacunisphaera limnophila]|uniref:hypothetical protein n=1 Tax=Lacunisphaera limnophila TaxID=1838286 RepID=UPI000859AAB3|nr:hypothetical protein [Lacunisphaera limnophila]
MKRALLLILLLAGIAESSAAYDKRLVYVLEQLRHCRSAFDEAPEIGGEAVGEGGAPHAFYLLYPYVRQFASDVDLSAMCHDKSPVVRVMAAKCIVNRKNSAVVDHLDDLSNDSEKLLVFPYGCSGFEMTVAEIVAKLKSDPDFPTGPKEPNQTPEPTAPSGGGSS